MADNIPLPYGGLTPEQIQQYLALNGGGPKATVGYNPGAESPAPSEEEDNSESESEESPKEQPKEEEDEGEEETSAPATSSKQSAYNRLLSYLKPSKPSSLNINVGQNAVNDKEALSNALQAQQASQLMGGLGKAGELIGSGIVGTTGLKPTERTGIEAFNEIAKAGDKALQNYQLQKEQQKDDPNSPMSNMFREYAKSLGVNINGDFTASMGEKLLPYVFKGFEAQQSQEARHEDVALKMLEMQERQADKLGEKAKDKQDRAMQQTKMLLESARGNPAAAQAERDIYSAQKADSLANLYGDPNKLSPQQVKLLASELAKIAQGGVPNMTELQGLTPNTLMSKFATVWGNLSNHPTPANAAAFVKQYQDYTHALTKDAQKVIKDKYGRVIESAKKQIGDDNYDQLKTQYLDRFKSEEQSSKGSISSKTLQDYAMKHNISVDDAKNLLSKAGYEVE